MKKNILLFIKENKWILLIMILLYLQRLYGMYTLGIEYSLKNDDLSYVNSGIEFAKSRTITMHGVLSAQIMPGMPVLIGFFSFVFGEGKLLWLVLKLSWFTMNSITAFFIYKTVTIFSPKWCGIIASMFLFAVDFVWMDNLILTETPFMLLFTIMIYSTVQMGKTKEKKYFWLCLSTYMLALMFKANIGIYPICAFMYLVLVKYDIRTLLKQGAILAGILLCFIVPWSIRNYIHYDAFIPLTYGSGNPKLLGTYQGQGYPVDEQLDYEKNVENVAKEKYSKYYDEEGDIEPYLERYVSLEKDGIKADYRLKEWIKRDPKSVLDSYLYLKPKYMINSVFYWQEIFDVPIEKILIFRQSEFWLCLFITFASFFLKRRRIVISFLWSVYLVNIYLYALNFSFSRYAATLMPVRFMIIGIGIPLIFQIILLANKSIKNEQFDQE